MRKLVNLVCLLFLSSCFLFAQDYSNSSARDANRNTAIRCLKLSENYFMSGDWENAARQAELGLAYDDNISDLIYLKAAADTRLNKPKAEILKSVKTAFEKNDWVSYTKDGARILYADLLSDVRKFEESFAVLDEDPLLFSADAEFIRIKNYYRMGTEKSIRDARDKVSVSSRIYPKDVRFPYIFFMFELMFMNEAERNGKSYTIPKNVQNIANVYIRKLPDYVGDNEAIEIMASFFADDSEKIRLVKAIDAKDQYYNTLLAYAGLKTGLYTEEQAFNMFFEEANNRIHLGLLENFALNIKEEGVKKLFGEKLLNYNGLLLIDNNFDLQPDITVKYKTGRPFEIKYDFDNDDVVDLTITCNFGVPGTVRFNNSKADLVYSTYPNVATVSYDEYDFLFKFYDGDYKVEPVKLIVNKIFSEFGLDFFVPEITDKSDIPSLEDLKKKANAVEMPIAERPNSKVVYTTFEGKPVFADFYEGDVKYGFCELVKGFPVSRLVDHDGDGRYETRETFNVAENIGDFITEEETVFVDRIFNPAVFDNNIYLMSVEIDRNGNKYSEFTEEYLGLGGKITVWDNDDNGIPDSKYIKYPREEGKELKEESVFFDSTGEPYISINFLGGVPVKMNYKNSEVLVFAGKTKDFYWVEQEGSAENEKIIMETVVPELSNGIIKIIQIEENRFSVIKVNDKIFCKIIPITKVQLGD